MIHNHPHSLPPRIAQTDRHIEGNIKQLPVTLFSVGVGIVLPASLVEIYVRIKHTRFLQQGQTGKSPRLKIE